MSFIVTPPSASAAMRGLGGEVDGVLVGVLAELGHVDPEDPDVVSSCRSSSVCRLRFRSCRLEAEADGLGAVVVGAERVRRQADLHAERTCSGSGSTLIDVAAHARAVAVDDRRHERHRDARRGERRRS